MNTSDAFNVGETAHLSPLPDQPLGKKPRRRWWCWALAVPLLLFLIMGALVLDRSPIVAQSLPPTAAQVRSAKALFSHVRRNAGTINPQPVAISWAEVASAASVANQLMAQNRIHVSHGGGSITINGSAPLPLGFWINAEGKAPHSPNGFPEVSGKIGRLPVPAWLAKPLIGLGRWFMGMRGISLPAPEKIIGGLMISDTGMIIKLAAPKNAGEIAGLVAGKLPKLDKVLVTSHYCRVAQSLKAAPVADFAGLVRRSFELSNGDSLASNRTAIVVLPMLIVSRQAGALADVDTEGTRNCAIAPFDPFLERRADLAKHWALSAAMTATVGAEVSGAMGTWKEIADSGPNGSGFSFVDLTADRSGIKFAQSLIDEASAARTRDRLIKATSADLLPVQALALAEGLSEADFKRVYASTDSQRYSEMIKRIDALLVKRLEQ